MKGRQQEAAYAARTNRTFRDGTCGDYDWDNFTSCSLGNREMNRIRRAGGNVDVPVDDEGRAILLSLADEVGRLGAPKKRQLTHPFSVVALSS